MNIGKFLLLFTACIIIGNSISEQSAVMAQVQDPPISSSDRVYKEPDLIPIFSGGTQEMHKFISNELKYPAEARENKIQGLVVYTFVVEKDGTLSNFNIIHRTDPLLDAEALRILQAMPPWRPARHNGEIVRSESYVPMYFKLNLNAMAAGAPVQPTRDYSKKDLVVLESNAIYTIVDKMPEYVYGADGLSAFIEHNIRYPREARQEGIEGRILCSFVVGSDGSISNIEVVDGANKALNEEAVRVLGLMPKWIPGENGGEKVFVKCLLPIDFVIDEEPIPPLESKE